MPDWRKLEQDLKDTRQEVRNLCVLSMRPNSAAGGGLPVEEPGAVGAGGGENPPQAPAMAQGPDVRAATDLLQR